MMLNADVEYEVDRFDPDTYDLYVANFPYGTTHVSVLLLKIVRCIMSKAEF